VLKINPKQGESLYARGIARLMNGRAADGKADIAAALAIDPGVAKRYSDYGVAPPN
jgi:hypothetical protein